MKNTIKKIIAVLVLSSIVFYSCKKEDSASVTSNHNAPHSVKIFLTDHQTPVFDSVFIDIQKLEVKVEDDSLNNEG
ncbi:MAG: hypothetical protein ABJA37_00305 [Ferruginibacter sp.]